MVRSLCIIGLLATIARAVINTTISFDTSPCLKSTTSISSTVFPDVLQPENPLLDPTGPPPKRGIDVVVATSAAAGARSIAVTAAQMVIQFYDNIAQKIMGKSKANSCTLTYDTASDNNYYEGYAYKAIITVENCDTTAILKSVQDKIRKCANNLRKAGVIRGCCRFSHGGIWTGHIRLSGSPSVYQAKDVDC